MKRFLISLFDQAMKANQENILRHFEPGAGGKLLDLGCDDGAWTSKIIDRLGKSKTEAWGLEIVEERAALARRLGIQVKIANLEERLPFDDNSFDWIHANQVIEHVAGVDHFASEIRRVLRPGGRAIISTENASSWHNVVATIMGWQIFSLTNLSAKRSGIGNPLALHRGSAPTYASWTHRVIFGYRGLIEFFEVHGFSHVRALGAGYYPLPAFFGRIDPRHAHFLAISATKL